MDLDSNTYFKLCSPNHDKTYERIEKALALLGHKHDQKCGALIFIVYLK
jgi:hypothetical protein